MARKTSSRVGRRRPMSSSSIALLAEQTHGVGESVGAFGDRNRDPAAGLVEPWRVGAERRQHLGDRGQVAAVRDPDLDHVEARHGP